MNTAHNIEAIIFDLGQVIVKVDHRETYKSLARVLNSDQNEIKELFKTEAYFLFELGMISEDQFFKQMRKAIPAEKIPKIEEAWNAMIVGIPIDSFSALMSLKNKFPLFALSNTNSSHVKAINRILANQYKVKDIKALFDKVYFSHELKLGKPDKKIFEHVLGDTKFEATKMLFIDDNLENIAAAIDLGFQTIHLKQQVQLLTKLKEFELFSAFIK